MQNLNILWGMIIFIIPWFLSRVACFNGGIHEAGLACDSYQYPADDDDSDNKLMQNLMVVMDAVSFQVKEHGWGAQTLVGRIYLNGCFLRYDNYTFFEESVDVTHDTNMCGSTQRGEPTVDSSHVTSVILNVSKGEHRFAVDEEGGVFAFAQCWETVDKWSCQRCLREAGKRVQECVPSAEGKSLFTGCFMRYSTRKFYNDVVVLNDTWITPPTQQEKHEWIILACVISAIVVIFLIITPSVFLSKNRKIPHEKKNKFGASPSFANVAGFSFRYDVLEKATGNFDPTNRLGMQGEENHGSVYKAILPSGRNVAVKRLYFDTRQWTNMLFNEINLINGIQHKNVVKLLGCSVDGPESLLVYEFLPNKSLDQILFDKDSENVLAWEKRFQIICGIAEGLAYLHEGSGTKIIHRDIKSSNILLDEAQNPKIVDFGLALCVAENKSHINTTKIAKTLGHMAPESIDRGQLTEKADIYAFGTMVIEIICGKKNDVFTQGSDSLLHYVWKNYIANNITISVDHDLHGNFEEEEASNALQASLLCTQSSPNLRPSMSEVVQMLTKKDYIIPIPKEQPFLNYTKHRTLASTMSLMSNGLTSTRSSFHSTTSSLHPGEDATLLENPFSSSARFNTSESPDSNIQTNIVVPQPR
ncbi:cysteine-rich receptor protein kinase [Trifolium repens]|nr:cysteine-rich receptor protein kinase [Trifolium repens]